MKQLDHASAQRITGSSPRTLGVLLSIFVFFTGFVFSQTERGSIRPPSESEFESVLDLVTINFSGPGRTVYENTVRIFDVDGSLWTEFSLLKSHPLYIENGTKNLKPLFPIKYGYFKLVGISKDWYQIEVNWQTKVRKFVRISDSFLKRESIQDAIQLAGDIRFDPATNPLRSSPGGEVLKEQLVEGSAYQAAGGVDGDWMQIVKTKSGGTTRGWIRWRRDSTILIAFTLNSLEVYSEDTSETR